MPTATNRVITTLSRRIIMALAIALIFFGPISVSASVDPPPVEVSRSRQNLKTIIVDNYQPYSFLNEKGESEGFSVEIARAVAKVMDFELDITVNTWEKAEKSLENGDIDLLPMMAYSIQRDLVFDFSVPHTIAYDAIFYNKNGQNPHSLADLNGMSVIVLNHDVAHDYLVTSGLDKTMRLQLVDSVPDALRQLAAGKADAAIMPKLVGIVTLKKLNLLNIETSPQLIDNYTRPFSFAVKDGNQPLLERLNQGLNIIKSTGQYDVIYKKWFGSLEGNRIDWAEAIRYIFLGALLLVAFFVWNVLLRRQVRLKTRYLEAEIVQRKRSESAVIHNAEMQTVLREIAEAAVLSTTMDELYRTVYRLLGKVLPAELFHINLLDEAAGEIVVPFKADDITFIPDRRPIDKGMTEYIMRLMHAVHITPAEMNRLSETGEYSLRKVQNVQTRHYLGAPLIDSKGRAFGVMSLILMGDEQTFQLEDIEVLSIIATQVSMAIERKQAEERIIELNAALEQRVRDLKRAEEETRAIVDNTADYVMRYDREYRHIFANSSTLTAAGVSLEEFTGATHRELGFPEHLCQLWEETLERVFQTKEAQVVEFEVDLTAGAQFLELKMAPEFTADGSVNSVVGVSRDISDRKRLETERLERHKKVARLERMASLGTLAAGVAHEINQPLQALKVTADGMLYWLDKEKSVEPEKLKENCSRISRSAERISTIVKRLRDFVNRSQTELLGAVNLNDAAKNVVEMLLARLTNHNITLLEDLSVVPPVVWGNSARLEEVYINLVVNAMQAMDSADSKELKRREIKISTACQPEKVILEIFNNGPAIPSDAVEKIFDPFYTTKINSENMGLGLSIVHSIVSEHGGHIIAINHDEGVSFRAEFPRHRG